MKKIITTGLLFCAVNSPLYAYAQMPVKTYSWTGFYIGANLGGVWSRFSSPITLTSSIATGPFSGRFIHNYAANSESVTGGGQFGYNYQYNNLLLGGEFSVNTQALNGDYYVVNASSPFANADEFTTKNNLKASLLAHVGYAGDCWSGYAIAGFAVANANFTANFIATTNGGSTFPSATINQSKTYYGGTGGIGVEYALFESLGIALEARYTGYLNNTYELGPWQPLP